MKLLTINKALNLLFLALVVEVNADADTETGTVTMTVTHVYIRTIFSVGWVKQWPHIRLIDWLTK